jgi:2-polyprenyl-6-hydroxyphenyl methylase / 3-demethylubiquinone-9 3-methyltransferase
MVKQASSIDPREIAHFDRLSADWWSPDGPMRPLHRLNPARIAWLRDRMAEHFLQPDGSPRDVARGRPLQNLRILDIGCGAGLLSEPMTRLGGAVTGIDPAERNILVARAHAEESGLSIDYRAESAEDLAKADERFDVVLAMEVVEHVASLRGFVTTACSLVAPGGLLFFSTLNRTFKSYALGIVAAEYVLRWLPRGTHAWEKFVSPQELEAALSSCGLRTTAETGVVFDPFRACWRLSRDMDVNYMIAAKRREP